MIRSDNEPPIFLVDPTLRYVRIVRAEMLYYGLMTDVTLYERNVLFIMSDKAAMPRWISTLQLLDVIRSIDEKSVYRILMPYIHCLNHVHKQQTEITIVLALLCSKIDRCYLRKSQSSGNLLFSQLA